MWVPDEKQLRKLWKESKTKLTYEKFKAQYLSLVNRLLKGIKK